MTLGDLAERLAAPLIGPKGSAGFYLVARFAPGRRGRADVIESPVLVMVDLDFGAWTADRIREAVLEPVAWIAHTTASHTDDIPKWRVVLPLDVTLDGDDWIRVARAVSRWFGYCEGVEKFDRCGEKIAQPIYWPTKATHDAPFACDGEIESAPIGKVVADRIIADEKRREAMAAEDGRKEREAREKARRARAARYGNAEDHPDVIARWNAAHGIEETLERYGYQPPGVSGGRWLSPNSSKGIPAVRVWPNDGRFYSHHGSDQGTDYQHGDAFDLFRLFEHEGDFTNAVRAAAIDLGMEHKSTEEKKRPDAEKAHGGPRGSLVAMKAAAIAPKAVRWVWRNYVPAGKITDAYGDGDMGKSMVLLDLAARVSNGGPMPDGSPGGPPGNVLIFAAEDDAADTIRPRLEAAGADLDRVVISDGTLFEGGRQRYLSIGEHLAELRATFTEHQPRLAVFDPVMAFMGSTKTGIDSEVRAALGPIKNLAADFDSGIASLRHINKATGAGANMRGTASTAFRNLARAGLVFGAHPDDENLRVMVPNKSNLGPRPPALIYSIEAVNGQPVVRWRGPCAFTAADVLGGERGAATGKGPRPGTKVESCTARIKELLADGPVRATAMEALLKGEKYGEDTIKAAKKYAGAVSRKDGDGPWEWRVER